MLRKDGNQQHWTLPSTIRKQSRFSKYHLRFTGVVVIYMLSNTRVDIFYWPNFYFWMNYTFPCRKGYNSQSSFYGVSQEKPKRSVYLLILLLNVLGDLFQHLNEMNTVNLAGNQMQLSKTKPHNIYLLKFYFLIVGFHAEEDCVRSEASKTALQIGPSSQFLCLSK